MPPVSDESTVTLYKCASEFSHTLKALCCISASIKYVDGLVGTVTSPLGSTSPLRKSMSIYVSIA